MGDSWSGPLPKGGGSLDQTANFLAAMQVLRREESGWQNAMKAEAEAAVRAIRKALGGG